MARITRCSSLYGGAVTLRGRSVRCELPAGHDGLHAHSFAARYWEDDYGYEADATTAALDALRAYAHRRPGLEWANYGDASAYRSDARRATRQLRDARSALEVASRLALSGKLTTADILAACKGDRLTLSRTGDTWAVDYCTGQYWPTEYRAAVARVALHAATRARRRCTAELSRTRYPDVAAAADRYAAGD